ncbi:Transcriptional regulatory protein LiaR [Phycisphaerae bacterium RAS1]|nr:Transcriptional regulatory protein LiaR [Phycisphaerae bacterium RAS1]
MNAQRVISVVLADDHAMVRDALAAWFAGQPDIKIVATAETTNEAVAAAVMHSPDVALLDIDMPGILAFDAAREIRRRSPNTRILFVSGFLSDRYIEQALAAGAGGYLTKGESPEKIAEAIRAMAAGAASFSADVQERIVIGPDGPHAAGGRTRAATLSPRELSVLRYVAQGMPKKEIAVLMNIGMKTVEKHVENIMRKLDIHDRVELARFAIREGMAEA